VSLGLLLAVSGAEARGGFGGGGGGGFHGGSFGGGGMAFLPHMGGGFGGGGGGFAMHGHPGFAHPGFGRFAMGGPGRQFGAMGWRHGNFHNFHNFHDGHFRHFHRNFVGFPFFVAGGGYPYDDYYDYGYYGGGCGWAYRNARATGSPYWRNRYYACVNYSY